MKSLKYSSMDDRIEQQRDELLAALQSLLADIIDLADEWYGVADQHKNGAVKTFGHIEAGERLERLPHLVDAIAAIANAQEVNL